MSTIYGLRFAIPSLVIGMHTFLVQKLWLEFLMNRTVNYTMTTNELNEASVNT